MNPRPRTAQRDQDREQHQRYVNEGSAPARDADQLGGLLADEEGQEAFDPEEGKQHVGDADDEDAPEGGPDEEGHQPGQQIGIPAERCVRGPPDPGEGHGDQSRIQGRLDPGEGRASGEEATCPRPALGEGQVAVGKEGDRQGDHRESERTEGGPPGIGRLGRCLANHGAGLDSATGLRAEPAPAPPATVRRAGPTGRGRGCAVRRRPGRKCSSSHRSPRAP